MLWADQLGIARTSQNYADDDINTFHSALPTVVLCGKMIQYKWEGQDLLPWS